MKILAIETSCDETAISIIEIDGGFNGANISVLGDVILSQAAKHSEFGGVYPTLAKREHANNIVTVLESALTQAGLNEKKIVTTSNEEKSEISKILEREEKLCAEFLSFITAREKPDIDAVAVTYGPGLAPALWIGVNFAQAMSVAWDIPVIPVNHLEGHIFASMVSFGQDNRDKLVLTEPDFPVIALIISGGHTELFLMKNWFSYKLVGRTRDDAIGEAFDKVARMLGLDYPGGPEISRLAEESREIRNAPEVSLPRPMINSNTCDFSFSGLKTAVLYSLKDVELTEDKKRSLAHEFENAVSEIL